MSLTGDLFTFLKGYEQATNTHNFNNVSEYIADDAAYWFSDGSFSGKEAIRKAFEDTWARIQNERYTISNIRWIAVSDSVAVCVYEFQWQGIVNGCAKEGRGRGANVFSSKNGRWEIVHEHLSVL